jgi:O-antigen/teichoic acid export membrane protein
VVQVKRIVGNFFSLSAGDLVSRLVGFSVTVYLANVLGPEGFGQISFALAFMSYFLLVGDMGTDTFGTRELSRGAERMGEDVENLISLKLLLAIISLILYVAVIWIIGFPDAFRNLLLLYGLAIIPMAFQGEWIFRGIQRMEFIGIGRLVKAAAYAVPVFLLVRGREQILRIPGCYALSIFIAALFLMGLYVKRTGLVHLKLRPRLWRSVLLRSIPIGFSLIMSKVYYNMDSVFLGFMKSDYSVGIYNAAYKVILFILSFWFIFGNVSFPAIT